MAEKHAPFITCKVKGKIEACINDDFLQAIKERNLKKIKSINDCSKFTQKRNKVNNIKHKLMQEYFSNLLINDAKRPNQLWNTLKTLVPNGKNTTTSEKD